jgi:hypothetical protein
MKRTGVSRVASCASAVAQHTNNAQIGKTRRANTTYLNLFLARRDAISLLIATRFIFLADEGISSQMDKDAAHFLELESAVKQALSVPVALNNSDDYCASAC